MYIGITQVFINVSYQEIPEKKYIENHKGNVKL